VDKPRTDQLDFVVCARIRTVAQFERRNYRRFPATVRPEADNWKANCRCSGVKINFVFNLKIKPRLEFVLWRRKYLTSRNVRCSISEEIEYLPIQRGGGTGPMKPGNQLMHGANTCTIVQW